MGCIIGYMSRSDSAIYVHVQDTIYKLFATAFYRVRFSVNWFQLKVSVTWHWFRTTKTIIYRVTRKLLQVTDRKKSLRFHELAQVRSLFPVSYPQSFLITNTAWASTAQTHTWPPGSRWSHRSQHHKLLITLDAGGARISLRTLVPWNAGTFCSISEIKT